MNKRKMGQIDEILEPAPRRGRPGIGLTLYTSERVVFPAGAIRYARTGRSIEPHPDEVIGKFGVVAAQFKVVRDRVVGHRRNFDALALRIIEPAVIGTAQAVLVDASDRQFGGSMKTPVGKCGQASADLGDHKIFA